jgi:hypothetical protein
MEEVPVVLLLVLFGFVGAGNGRSRPVQVRVCEAGKHLYALRSIIRPPVEADKF